MSKFTGLFIAIALWACAPMASATILHNYSEDDLSGLTSAQLTAQFRNPYFSGRFQTRSSVFASNFRRQGTNPNFQTLRFDPRALPQMSQLRQLLRQGRRGFSPNPPVITQPQSMLGKTTLPMPPVVQTNQNQASVPAPSAAILMVFLLGLLQLRRRAVARASV